MSSFDFNSEFELSSLDYWRLCDELNIIQAALLVSGHDPAEHQENIENWKSSERPEGYEAAKTAITHAIIRTDIEGNIHFQAEYDINGNNIGWDESKIDLENSTADVTSMKIWLKERGFKTGFFFPSTDTVPDYLDTAHPRYSPKLAATVNAWFAFENLSSLKGKTAKQALEKWLREHASQYALSDEEGKPNEKGIEECAKVANWNIKGGAPKTPS